jgi:sigma-B regulation protein RsbU (phosphoserine phosphatase)
MYRERIFFNRTHDRRQHSSCAELVRALPDGLPVSGERRRLPERRREGLASKLQLFRDIPSDIVEALLQSCPLREFSAETIVLQPGDANENIYVLLAGRLRVHLDASDSANHILIEAGGCIGELSIIDGKPVSAWVVAERGSRLLIIAQQAFWSRIIPHPGIARNLLRVLTERMRHNNETILQGLRQQLVYEHMQKELELAREIQTNMLPKPAPSAAEGRSVEICAAMEPARLVGGDLYDFFYTDQGELCFVVGDVSDKGLPAALFMARTTDIVRVVTRLLRAADGGFAQAHEIIACVNRELCQNNASFMFVTMFFGMLEPRSGTLHYCNAGHNSPYVVDGCGSLRPLHGARSNPLGIKGDSAFRTESLTLESSDLLFVFSDGIPEAMTTTGDFYGEQRLENALAACAGRDCAEVVAAIMASVKQFAGGAAQSDDITALALRRQSPA